MARVDLFSFTRSISNESTDHADVKEVTVEIGKETVKPVKEDTDQIIPDAEVDVEKTNVKTSQPGPKDGGGDGTAHTVDAKQASVKMDLTDVDENLTRDQNGGHDIDALPGKVNAKDNLSASDIRTSVEEHTDVKEGKDNAEESELKTIETGGAECVPEADAMVMDLDGEELEVVGMTDATDKGLSEADAAFAKVNELKQAVASVERYVNLLDRMDMQGKTLSTELRQTISWALEDIDSQLFHDVRVTLEAYDPHSKISMEANVPSTQLDTGDDPSEVKKGLSAKLKKLWEAAVRMFWRAFNATTEVFTGLIHDLPGIRNHLTELRNNAKVLEGGKDVTIKDITRLAVGDEFVGDSAQALQQVSKVTEELLLKWPNQLAKILGEWGESGDYDENDGPKQGDERKALGNAKLMDDYVDLIGRSFSTLKPLSPSDKDKVPSGFLNVNKLLWSGPLPGNRALYVGFNETAIINFSLIPGYDAHVGQQTVKTLSAGEANIVIRGLEKLLNQVEDCKAGMKKVKVVAESLQNRARGQSYAYTNSIAEAGVKAMHIAEHATTAQNQYFGYLIRLIKGYMGYISASIKAEASSDNTLEGELAA